MNIFLAVTSASTFFVAWFEHLYAFYSTKGKIKRGYTFSLSANILELIYTQCLVWYFKSFFCVTTLKEFFCRIGLVYSPITPVISSLLSFITFYIKFYTLRKWGTVLLFFLLKKNCILKKY